MKFTCDQCGTRYSIADEKVERKILKIRCKVCKFVMVVRGSDRLDESVVSMAAALESKPEIEWYVALAGQQHGPMPIERVQELIQEEQLSAQDLVWNESMSGWEEASTVAAISSLFPPAKPAMPPPLPPMPSVAPDVIEPPIEELGDSAIMGPDLSMNETNEDPSAAAQLPQFEAIEEYEGDGDDDEAEQESPELGRPTLDQTDSEQKAIGDSATLAYGSTGRQLSPSSDFLSDMEEEGETLMEDGASFVSDLISPTNEEAKADYDEDFALADTGAEPVVPHVPVDRPTTPSERPPEQQAGLTLPISDTAQPSIQRESVEARPLPVVDIPTQRIIPSEDALAQSEAERAEDSSAQDAETHPTTGLSTDHDAAQPASSPAAMSTLPVHREKKTSVGLVVAASIIGAAAMFCAVWFGLRGAEETPATKPEKTLVVSTQSSPEKTKVTPVAVDATVQDASPTDAGGLKAPDAAKAVVTKADPDEKVKPKSREKTSEKSSQKAPEQGSEKSSKRKKRRRGDKTKQKKPTKSNLLAGKNKKKTKARTSARRSSLFSGGPGPSSLLPDTAGKEKEESRSAGLTDGLNQAEVVKVIAQYKKGLNGCYQRQLKREPLRDSRLMLKFRIRPSGRTSNVSIGKKYDGTVLKSCLDALVRRWRFPQFRGEPIDIEYPLIFAKPRF